PLSESPACPSKEHTHTHWHTHHTHSHTGTHITHTHTSSIVPLAGTREHFPGGVNVYRNGPQIGPLSLSVSIAVQELQVTEPHVLLFDCAVQELWTYKLRNILLFDRNVNSEHDTILI